MIPFTVDSDVSSMNFGRIFNRQRSNSVQCSRRVSATTCSNGYATDFACHSSEALSPVPSETMYGATGSLPPGATTAESHSPPTITSELPTTITEYPPAHPSGLSARRRAIMKRQLHANADRFVCKEGMVNIGITNVRKRKRRFLSDIFTTLLEIRWRYLLLVFATSFVLSWLLFATIWWLISWAHDDLGGSRVGEVTVNTNNGTTLRGGPCVMNLDNFDDAFIFSIETQHTIGYGFRYITGECRHATLLLMIQSCTGVMIQALMAGLVFAKLARPKRRAETLMFSRYALIGWRDDEPRDDGSHNEPLRPSSTASGEPLPSSSAAAINQSCDEPAEYPVVSGDNDATAVSSPAAAYHLMFRIADMRTTPIVEAHVRAFLVTVEEEEKVTAEASGGQRRRFLRHRELDLGYDAGLDRLFVGWPVTVYHRIDERSPLWRLASTDLHHGENDTTVPTGGHPHWEIIVLLEGIVETTGMTAQARTSYLASEVRWGHQFCRLPLIRHPTTGATAFAATATATATPFAATAPSDDPVAATNDGVATVVTGGKPSYDGGGGLAEFFIDCGDFHRSVRLADFPLHSACMNAEAS